MGTLHLIYFKFTLIFCREAKLWWYENGDLSLRNDSGLIIVSKHGPLCKFCRKHNIYCKMVTKMYVTSQ